MTMGLPESSQGSLASHACDLILARSKPGTALAIGPGLGRSSSTDAMVETLYRDEQGREVQTYKFQPRTAQELAA